MSERAAVTVVGIGDDGWDGLTETARAALRQAPVIIGSARQLALLPDLGVRQLPLPSPLLAQLDDLVGANPGLCLLASGDPMLHGLGATLARRLGTGRLRVLPAVSSVALACARLGWAEHEVDVVSLVSRPAEAVLPAVQPGARVLAFCRDGGTPAVLARLLADRGWGGSELTVLEHLGGPAERVGGPVAAAALGEDRCADLVALVCRPGPDATVQPRVPGLPDDAYESDGQLTRREARALALAALAPGPGQLLWDVGAGSGSIGIEWMRVDARCRAVAVERHGDRAERVRRNALALGVPDLEVVCGDAPAALTSLLHISAAQQPFPPPLFHGQVVLANCRESVYLFNQSVHLGPQLSAGRSHQPGRRSRPTLPAAPQPLAQLRVRPQPRSRDRLHAIEGSPTWPPPRNPA